MEHLIVFENVTKRFYSGSHTVSALDNASFTIDEGEFVVILGPSGAGKSTLLNLLGGMDTATQGKITVNGLNIVGMGDKQLTKYRAENVGFVFQFYNLIPNLTSRENVALVKSICKNSVDANKVLRDVGLEDHADQFPSQLSGGEQQRVSIARALAKNPKLLLCDEPTGALDSVTGMQIFSTLRSLCDNEKKTVIIVTHNSSIAPAADRVIRLKNGKIQSVEKNESPLSISEVSDNAF